MLVSRVAFTNLAGVAEGEQVGVQIVNYVEFCVCVYLLFMCRSMYIICVTEYYVAFKCNPCKHIYSKVNHDFSIATCYMYVHLGYHWASFSCGS